MKSPFRKTLSAVTMICGMATVAFAKDDYQLGPDWTSRSPGAMAATTIYMAARSCPNRCAGYGARNRRSNESASRERQRPEAAPKCNHTRKSCETGYVADWT